MLVVLSENINLIAENILLQFSAALVNVSVERPVSVTACQRYTCFHSMFDLSLMLVVLQCLHCSQFAYLALIGGSLKAQRIPCTLNMASVFGSLRSVMRQDVSGSSNATTSHSDTCLRVTICFMKLTRCLSPPPSTAVVFRLPDQRALHVVWLLLQVDHLQEHGCQHWTFESFTRVLDLLFCCYSPAPFL